MMSDGVKKPEDGPGPSKSTDSPSTQARKLKERVTFFEKIWTGLENPEKTEEIGIDVGEIEKKLQEERKKQHHEVHLEHVALKSTPLKRVVQEKTWEGTFPTERSIDISEIERKLEEERRKHTPGSPFEHITLKSTPVSSPKRIVEERTWMERPLDVSSMERRLEEERRKHAEHAHLQHVQLRPTFSPKNFAAMERHYISQETDPIAHVVTQEGVDVKELERRLQEERRKNITHIQLEPVHLKHTINKSDNDNFEETFERTIEEGDLSSGSKVVKFEKITVRKTTKEIVKPFGSRTPSEEHLLEDSAYHSHGNGVSKSSSVTSLTGRFPSEESLRRTPSKENIGKDDWDSASSSSKHTTSGSEWYNEYKTHSFFHSGSKLDFVRSKSQYDSHIAEIRGKNTITIFYWYLR